MTGKKWIALALSAILVSSLGIGYLLIYGVKDYDGDGVQNIFDQYPNDYNFPVTRYAKQRLPSETDFDKFAALDQDVQLDQYEKRFIDYLATLDNSKRQKYVADILADEKLSEGEKRVLDYVDFIKTGLIPENVRSFYSDWEISNIQSNLFNSILENSRVDDSEVEVLEKLRTERWYVARDIINSGMIRAKVLGENWDSDLRDGKPLSNFDEILQGTNPLNKLEVDPSNLSDRYAVLVFSCASQEDWKQLPMAEIDVRNAVSIYSMLLKNGYSADKITLIIDPGPKLANEIENYNMEVDFSVEYENGQVISGSREAMADYFFSQSANLSSDGNDLVLIQESAHGNSTVIRLGGRILGFAEYNRAQQMSYGELVSIFSSCYSEGYINNIHGLNNNPNMLLIAVSSGNEEGTQNLGLSILKNMAIGISVEACATPFTIFGGNKPSINPFVYTKPQMS